MTKKEKLKAWFEDKKAAHQQRAGARREWKREHPKEYTWITIITVSTIGRVAIAGINYKLKTATQKPKTLWDPSMGYHQELKADINRLTSNGYKRHEALEILGLI